MRRRNSRKCQWPGCETTVAVYHWGCHYHYSKLPDGIQHKLNRLKHWWPEWKLASREARAFAKAHDKVQTAKPERRCPACGGSPSQRFTNGMCVPCQIAMITGDKND